MEIDRHPVMTLAPSPLLVDLLTRLARSHPLSLSSTFFFFYHHLYNPPHPPPCPDSTPSRGPSPERPPSPETKVWSVDTHPRLSLATRSTANPQIKKNTAPHELKPSDILIERFTAWKQIVKMLIGGWLIWCVVQRSR